MVKISGVVIPMIKLNNFNARDSTEPWAENAPNF